MSATRDDQIRAARELAERNEEWALNPDRPAAAWLQNETRGWDLILGDDGKWWGRRCGVAQRGANKRLRRFDSPAAAIRALGYDVREEGDTP